jgi:hypothetical protein
LEGLTGEHPPPAWAIYLSQSSSATFFFGFRQIAVALGSRLCYQRARARRQTRTKNDIAAERGTPSRQSANESPGSLNSLQRT